MTFPLVELFASLQGEGRNTGRPCVFVRFAGCNLACPWCDTSCVATERLDFEALLARIAAFPERSVIFTGGEPLLQPGLPALAAELKARGYWLALETNATCEPAPALRACLDYIATSPKLGAPIVLTQADEVRLVVAPEVTQAWCEEVRRRLPASEYYLSPCDAGGTLHVHEAITLLGRLNASAPTPPWRLSVQSHKLAAIR